MLGLSDVEWAMEREGTSEEINPPAQRMSEDGELTTVVLKGP